MLLSSILGIWLGASQAYAQEVIPKRPGLDKKVEEARKEVLPEPIETAITGRIFRGGLLFATGRPSLMHSPVSELNPTTGLFEMDVGPMVAAHFGLGLGFDQDVNYNGQRWEAYTQNFEIGIRAFYSQRYFEPFVGAGYMLGRISTSQPGNRGNNDVLVIFEGERSGTWGWYTEAGVQGFITPGFGFKLLIRRVTIETESLASLGGQKVNSTQIVPMFGLAFSGNFIRLMNSKRK